VILEASSGWSAPGHNAVIETAAVGAFILYHAVDAVHPRSRPEDEVNTRRVMLVDRLEWRDGWPAVARGD
jgi:arabinan endo-1,5-alpha-L-arabinosidase